MIFLMIYVCFEGNDYCGIFFLYNLIFLFCLLGLVMLFFLYLYELLGKWNLLFK